ncbi:MAG TPA: hypothetical protein VM265_04100 [Sphingomicrobium sp.]|nr:hypothetical protein [Sphingomicrobium sp.]
MSDAIKQPEPEHRPEEAGPPPGTPVVVRVTARPGADDIDWSLKWQFRGQSDWHDDPIVIPPKKKAQPATPITFELIDETRRCLKFQPTARDAIWSLRSGCPGEKLSSHDTELELNGPPPQSKQLTIVDRNWDKCSVYFRLRFRDDAGKEVSYDPEIRNGGSN